MRALWVFLALSGCGGKEDAGVAPSGGTGTGSANGSATSAKGSATPTAGSATGSGSAATAKPAVKKGKLELESPDSETFGLSYAFSGRIPVLPAVSSDGTLIADFDTGSTGMPVMPMPYFLSISPILDKGKPETLPLIDSDMANTAETDEHNPDGGWRPNAAITKKVRDRAATILKRLRDGGFGSLHRVEIEDDGAYGAKATKIGTVALAAKRTDDEDLIVTLTDAAGKSLHKETIKGYSTKESPESFAGAHCSYTPFFSAGYTDQAKRTLYVYVRFRFNEECTPQPIKVLAWPLPEPPPPPPDEAAVIALASDDLFGEMATPDKVFAKDAQLIAGTTIAGPSALPWQVRERGEIYSGRDDANLQVVMSRDGKSAWASLTTTLGILVKSSPGRDDPWRASYVMAKGATGWQIVAATWTVPVKDAVSEAEAKAGKRKAGTFAGDGGDKELRDAFAKLVSAGVDADASKRPDLVLLGTAPGERTVGGAQFAKVWNGAFKGKVSVVSSTAKLAPSGTTGWVAATLELPQKGYKLPFQAFCVFDKAASGWTLVHAHFSVN